MNTGTPMLRKTFGEHLQGDRLAGAGGAGDQAVAVGQRGSRARSVCGVWQRRAVQPSQLLKKEQSG
jgi:hypothetical protein